MKRWTTLGGLALGFLLVTVFFLHGQPRVETAPEAKKTERKISTSGSATIRVKPDSARIFFGVQTVAQTVKQARAESAQKVKAILDALNALKIADLKMKTSEVSVDILQRSQDTDRVPVITGYRLTNSFTVLITNDNPQHLGHTAGLVLDTVLEAGANVVQQIAIFKQDTSEARRQALAKAVEDARANAAALAEGTKATIKDTIDISGQPQYYFGARNVLTNAQQAFNPGAGGEETAVLAGEIEVSCQVSVTCTY